VRAPGGLWRHPDFLKLWSAETISQFGTQVSLLAVPLVAIVLLDATPFEVALLGTIEFLPFILFSLPAGAWVDRLRRRPILIAGDLGRAISLASIPIAHWLGMLTVGQLYVVGFVNGVLTVFFDVAYQSYLPSLVNRDQIVEGNSKLEISRTLAQTAGPALGGGLIGLVTAPIAIIGDALSFAGSALFVVGIRKREPAPDRHVDEHGQARQGIVAEVRDGLHYVLGNRYLRPIAACTGFSNLCSNIAFATLLVYLVRDLGLEAATIGIVLGIGNVGAIVAAFTGTRVSRRFGVGPTIVGSSLLIGLAAVITPLAPPGPLLIPLLILAGLLVGFGIVIYNITQVSFRQAITPERMQGRMNATMRFIVWGTMPIGSLLGGFLATTIGVHETMYLGTLLGTLSFLPVLLSPVRTLQEMPELASDKPLDERLAEASTPELEVDGLTSPAPVDQPDQVSETDSSRAPTPT
jgi:MFS family permease